MLTIEEKLIFRNIRKSAIIWLLMIRIDPEPLTEAKAADILAIDRGSVRRYFNNLSEIGIISRLGRYKGYILSQAGRQLTLPLELEKMNKTPSAININEEESFKEEESLILIDEGEKNTLPKYKDHPEEEKALLQLGILENTRTRKLLLDLTVKDIQQTAAKLRHNPYHSINETGLLIFMLEGAAEKKKKARQSYAEWEE